MKRVLLKVLGGLLLSTPLIGMFIVISLVSGFLFTLTVFGIAVGAIGVMIAGLHLLTC